MAHATNSCKGFIRTAMFIHLFPYCLWLLLSQWHKQLQQRPYGPQDLNEIFIIYPFTQSLPTSDLNHESETTLLLREDCSIGNGQTPCQESHHRNFLRLGKTKKNNICQQKLLIKSSSWGTKLYHNGQCLLNRHMVCKITKSLVLGRS